MEDLALIQAIQEAKELARHGTSNEKAEFVEWACDSINYLSSQVANGCGDENTALCLKRVKLQYEAYLNELKER